MSKPFDATMRKLIELEPAAWLRFLHIPIADPSRVRVIDSNLSTVSAEADRVFWIDELVPWIEHVELQAAREVELAERVHWYSTALRRSRKVPVHTTIVLLRPAADGADLTGTLKHRDRNGDVYNWFRYNVVRIWQQPVEEVLAAGLPVLPLAPVSDIKPEELDRVLVAISDRFLKETSPDRAATFWAATKVMMGLRYSKVQVDQITERVAAMTLGIRGIEESSVYQDIFAKGEARGRLEGEAKGRVEHARAAILRVGSSKLGEANEAVREKLRSISDVDQLDTLLDRILSVSSWDDLLNTPAPPA